MDIAGVDGRAAEPEQQQRPGRDILTGGQQQDNDRRGGEGIAEAGQGSVVKAAGEEAGKEPAGRYPEVEHAGEAGGGLLVHAQVEHEIAGGPEAGGLLHAAVAEKGEHVLPHAALAQQTAVAYTLAGVSAVFPAAGAAPR